jgi:hypothetical protein
MKNVPGGLRITTVLMALTLGWFAIATIFAETLTPKTRYFSTELAPPDPISQGSLADRAAVAAPLRGDLLAGIAMARAAASAPGPGNGPATPEMLATRERALGYARQSLSFAPHSSSVWLLLGMLESPNFTRLGENQRSVAEALKMSYLTSRADVNLIPARLAIVATLPAIADAELKSLASGDIRLILTRRPDLKPALTGAYRQGTADGRAYIDDVVRSIDPGFAASLR